MTHALTLLRGAGVTVNWKKIKLFSNTINYQGRVIHPGQLAVLQPAIDRTCNLNPPANITELRSFLASCNVFRRFVPKFTHIAAELNRKLRKDQMLRFAKLSNDKLLALQTLQRRLITVPVLYFPRSTGTYTRDSDACEFQVGCVLFQQHPKGLYRRIAWWWDTSKTRNAPMNPLRKSVIQCFGN